MSASENIIFPPMIEVGLEEKDKTGKREEDFSRGESEVEVEVEVEVEGEIDSVPANNITPCPTRCSSCSRL